MYANQSGIKRRELIVARPAIVPLPLSKGTPTKSFGGVVDMSLFYSGIRCEVSKGHGC